MLTNTLFGTRPVVVHSPGYHHNPAHWDPLLNAFFSTAPRVVGSRPDLTVLTCNNGAGGMGLLERSLAHLGLPCAVVGRGVDGWANSRHKPTTLLAGLCAVETEYVVYADSRDAIVLDDPGLALERFLDRFDCDLLFGADRMNWPPLHRFKRFEDTLCDRRESDFRYLNGGAWIGRTDFAREFFLEAAGHLPAAEAPDSEQGVLKTLFQRHHPRVQLDYRCEIMQNISFVIAPIFSLDEGPGA